MVTRFDKYDGTTMLDLATLAAAAFPALSQEAAAAAVEPKWSALGVPLPPGKHDVELVVPGSHVTIPHCNGRKAITVDGHERDAGSKGPLDLDLGGPGEHRIVVTVDVSTYE